MTSGGLRWIAVGALTCLTACAAAPRAPGPPGRARSATSSPVAAVASATTAPTAALAATAATATSRPQATTLAAGRPAVTDTDPRDTLPFLASDTLEGRLIGTPGLEQAGDFIAAEFAAAGLKPVPGQSGYFQPVTYHGALRAGSASTLSIADQKLTLDQDFVPANFSADKTFAGDLAFVGYGISAPDAGYDDYAGIDVHGKVVLILRYEPMDANGNSRLQTAGAGWSRHATFDAKIKTAVAHGAAGVLLVNSPGAGADTLLSIKADYGVAPAPIPVLSIRQTVADRILQSAGGDDLKTAKGRIDATLTNQSRLLATAASGRVAIERSSLAIRNVMGCIPGQGPHAAEYVVIGAHYDHLGKGQLGSQFGRVGSIYHGTDDNASGTAAVLELAARFARRAAPPPRTLVFVCFTGEEEGLIGSEEFVTHPPIPLADIVAMLNFDMIGRLKNQTLYIGGQGTAIDFDTILAAAQPKSKLTIKSAGRGGLGPSDHMSFTTHHIPVMFLFTGLHIDYHRPTDVAAKINFAGLEQIADFATDVIDGMAQMPHDPYLVEADKDSFSMFGPGGLGLISTTNPSRRAILGVMPDYNSEDSRAGVIVSGITPGTPAEKIGLRNGDLIVQFAGQEITNLMDLTSALARSKPGDPVKLKYVRNNQTLSADVILAERQN